MAITVLVKNKDKVEMGILGFSWTVFFFGLFVPLFRRDFKVFLPFFLIYLFGFFLMPYTYTQMDGMISFQMEDTLGLYSTVSTFFYFLINIIGAFFYNRFYTQRLINRGFYPVSPEGKALLTAFSIKLPEYHDNEDQD